MDSSREQVTQLIDPVHRKRSVRSRQGCGQRVTARHNPGDIGLLPAVAEADETLTQIHRKFGACLNGHEQAKATP